MSGTSESDSVEEWIPFSHRADWNDIKPLPQQDGEECAVPIAYSAQCEYQHSKTHFTVRETMDYFRAIVAKGECSERAMALTAEVLDLNPANYSVWHYRRKILKTLPPSLLKVELAYISDIILNTPKNYQVWHHRRRVIEELLASGQVEDAGKSELVFTARVLDDDAKNYHAWSYRQWIITEFNQWEGELDYVDSLLAFDFRNNSAWNERHFVVFSKPVTTAVQEREVRLALDWIGRAPNNEAPWQYLRSFFTEPPHTFPDWLIEEVSSLSARFPACPHALSLLVDAYEVQGAKARAHELCVQLAKSVDEVRKGYWEWRAEKLG